MYSNSKSSGEAVVRIETKSTVAGCGRRLLRQQGASTKPHRNAPQHRAVLTAQHCVQTAQGLDFQVVLLEWWQQARDTAPSSANLRQITANLINMHPAEIEGIVLQLFSLRASRVQAYGCYGLLREYRAEQSQFQEYDHSVRIDVDTHLQILAGNSCNSCCSSL